MTEPLTAYEFRFLDEVEKKLRVCLEYPLLLVRYMPWFGVKTYFCEYPAGLRILITQRKCDYLVRLEINSGTEKFKLQVLVTADVLRQHGHLAWIPRSFEKLKEKYVTQPNQQALLMDLERFL